MLKGGAGRPLTTGSEVRYPAPLVHMLKSQTAPHDFCNQSRQPASKLNLNVVGSVNLIDRVQQLKGVGRYGGSEGQNRRAHQNENITNTKRFKSSEQLPSE